MDSRILIASFALPAGVPRIDIEVGGNIRGAQRDLAFCLRLTLGIGPFHNLGQIRLQDGLTVIVSLSIQKHTARASPLKYKTALFLMTFDHIQSSKYPMSPDSSLYLDPSKFIMEWPTSPFPLPQEDTAHPDRLPIDPFLFPRSPAVSGPQPVSPVFANHPNGAFTSIAGLTRSIGPHDWTVNPTGGLLSDKNVPAQGGVAQIAQTPFAHDEIPVESLDLLYASTKSGQPRRDWLDTNADKNSTWIAPNTATSHQQQPAPERYVACFIRYP